MMIATGGWDEVGGGGEMVMSAIVEKKEFAEGNSERMKILGGSARDQRKTH